MKRGSKKRAAKKDDKVMGTTAYVDDNMARRGGFQDGKRHTPAKGRAGKGRF